MSHTTAVYITEVLNTQFMYLDHANLLIKIRQLKTALLFEKCYRKMERDWSSSYNNTDNESPYSNLEMINRNSNRFFDIESFWKLFFKTSLLKQLVGTWKMKF